MSTQRYDVLSGRIGYHFIDILLVEIENICNIRWNAERVAVFQTVFLLRICLVSVSRNIRDWVSSHILLWNRVVFYKLVKYYYIALEEILGNNCGTQNQEQHHRTFSNLVIRGKFHKAV